MSRMKTLNQLLTDNPNLLSFVVVPQAQAEDLDSATLKTAIIRRCGDVAPYYQKAADFTLFGTMWFNTHSFLFAHALEVWNATYNPIENYDRTETETIESSRINERDNTDTHSGTDETTTSGTRNNSSAHGGTDTTTRNLTDRASTNRETEIAGFNSSTYSDANKEVESGTTTKTGTEALQHGETLLTDESTSGTERLNYGHRIESGGRDTEDGEVTRNGRIHGNIGVTTAQQMLEAELNLADKFWIYDYIASAFETDNFITVYDSYYESSAWG